MGAVEVDVASNRVKNAVKGECVTGIEVDASPGADTVQTRLDLAGKVDRAEVVGVVGIGADVDRT